jgi:hypothetical protein
MSYLPFLYIERLRDLRKRYLCALSDTNATTFSRVLLNMHNETRAHRTDSAKYKRENPD